MPYKLDRRCILFLLPMSWQPVYFSTSFLDSLHENKRKEMLWRRVAVPLGSICKVPRIQNPYLEPILFLFILLPNSMKVIQFIYYNSICHLMQHHCTVCYFHTLWPMLSSWVDLKVDKDKTSQQSNFIWLPLYMVLPIWTPIVPCGKRGPM